MWAPNFGVFHPPSRACEPKLGPLARDSVPRYPYRPRAPGHEPSGRDTCVALFIAFQSVQLCWHWRFPFVFRFHVADQFHTPVSAGLSLVASMFGICEVNQVIIAEVAPPKMQCLSQLERANNAQAMVVAQYWFVLLCASSSLPNEFNQEYSFF